MEVYAFSSFNEFLVAKFEQRAQANPRYSLRAFARDVKLSPSRLTELFKGQAISVANAEMVCDNFEVTGEERNFLLDLARRAAARSDAGRLRADSRIQESKTRRSFVKSNLHAEVLNRWYALPLAEYLSQAKPLSVAAVAEKLNISADDAYRTVKEMKLAGLLEEKANNCWIKKAEFFLFESPQNKSSLIRTFHKQYLLRASEALEQQQITKRKYLTSVFSIDAQDLEEARTELENFSAKFLAKFSKPSAREVYVMSMQLYDVALHQNADQRLPREH
ncbi:MAG: TIGR02147 family protein [Proteobacteria bacterium]|nr:MAG: TIGR02147 family protein [Pseudomonadota bacterium]